MIKAGHIEKGELEAGEGSAMPVRDLKGRHTPRVFQELQTGPCARRTSWRRVVLEQIKEIKRGLQSCGLLLDVAGTLDFTLS